METEIRLNRSRMNPHFFFNVLTSIQTLSLQKDNEKKVTSYLAKFAKIMRISLESSYSEMVTLVDEKEFLEKYLDIQRFYKGDLFSYSITVDTELNEQEILIPGMLLQPLIENSIEHGFNNITNEGLIQISFQQKKDSIIIILEDNGRWKSTELKDISKPTSRSMQIVKERLELLSLRYSKKSFFNINNSDSGTLIQIELPIFTKDEMSNYR